MAQFKELTHDDGKKVTVNVDAIQTMRLDGPSTIINFAKCDIVVVKETPNDILMRPHYATCDLRY
jgi:uncharacterized protein YlzI (FlbEa/FlbD family)